MAFINNLMGCSVTIIHTARTIASAVSATAVASIITIGTLDPTPPLARQITQVVWAVLVAASARTRVEDALVRLDELAAFVGKLRAREEGGWVREFDGMGRGKIHRQSVRTGGGGMRTDV